MAYGGFGGRDSASHAQVIMDRNCSVVVYSVLSPARMGNEVVLRVWTGTANMYHCHKNETSRNDPGVNEWSLET